jgi:predicted helicase
VNTALDNLLVTLSPDGRDFEHLTRWFLRSDPEAVAEYEKVWLWDDWPGRWGRDKGIDLVAETRDGRVVAIQAKNYGAAHSITKRDVDTFLSESSRAVISSRLLVATTDRVAASAREVMRHQEKPVSTALLATLQASPVVWPTSIGELAPMRPPRATPREHQQEALAAIEAWVDSGDPRAQVVMACGTGKSLVGVWCADRMDARRVLVLAPTLDLLRQLSRDWMQHAAIQRRLLHISSDSDRLEDDVTRGDELGTARTTNPELIADRLRSSPDLVVLCTYNSSKVLAEAMRQTEGVEFDLAVVDEAHRCAGAATSTYKTILKPEAIRARRRLFFTATPVVFSTHQKSRATTRNVRVASMDNHEFFGRVVHRLSFAEAIERGLLCRYQVAIIPIKDEDVQRLIDERRFVTADGDQKLLAGSLATQIACARAMRRYGCHRVVAFQPTIPQSRRFAGHFPLAAALLPADERPEGELWSHHVDGGTMPFATRTRLIDQFKSSDKPDEYRLLSNVRLLAEGVDAPGIDAVAFVDTRRGHAQIVQAVGRAVRTAPGKDVGTIVLPVVQRRGETIEAALARTEHRMVVDVLGALRSHDPEIVKSLDTLRFGLGPEHDPGSTSGRFVIDAAVDVGEDFANAVQVALANALSVVPAAQAAGPAATAALGRDDGVRARDARPRRGIPDRHGRVPQADTPRTAASRPGGYVGRLPAREVVGRSKATLGGRQAGPRGKSDHLRRRVLAGERPCWFNAERRDGRPDRTRHPGTGSRAASLGRNLRRRVRVLDGSRR